MFRAKSEIQCLSPSDDISLCKTNLNESTNNKARPSPRKRSLSAPYPSGSKAMDVTAPRRGDDVTMPDMKEENRATSPMAVAIESAGPSPPFYGKVPTLTTSRLQAVYEPSSDPKSSTQDMFDATRPQLRRRHLWTEQDNLKESIPPNQVWGSRAQVPLSRNRYPFPSSPSTSDSKTPLDPSNATPLGRPSGQSSSNCEESYDIKLEPENRPVSQEQLVAEVKGIYAGIVMLEAKCLEVDTEQATLAQHDAEAMPKLNNEQWQALIALHRTLLHEHYDFFLASQHPSASPALRRLASKYAMPARMWRHGIHSFLELLRHRLPASRNHMLAFIYLAYSMMTLLYETVPAFETTWIECLGDLGRYRMAIEDEDIRDREVWTSVARQWYSKASDKAPTTGRLYHHLSILARPNALQQLFYYSKSLCVVAPFKSAKESILSIWKPPAPDEHKPGRSFLKRTYSKIANFKRKAVRILFNGKETFARPDTASDQNVITEAFANEHGIPIQVSESDQSILELGNGKYVKTVGRAKVPIKVLGGNRKISKEDYQWFDVLPKCPVPLILGMGFIEKIKLWTKNKHLLVDSPHMFVKIPTFKWIGSPRGFINFSANGQHLEGCADTGSDLDFMSPECAERLGLKIDTDPSICTRVMLADESIVNTIGQVQVSSIELSDFDNFDMKFHILPGLASDVIFSEEFLDQMDAFNTCAQIKDSKDSYQQRLNIVVSLGPIHAFLSRTWKPDPTNSAQQVHDNGIEAERLRRNKANRAIRKIKSEEQASAAQRAEDLGRASFDRRHEQCRYCIGLPGQVQAPVNEIRASQPSTAAENRPIAGD